MTFSALAAEANQLIPQSVSEDVINVLKLCVRSTIEMTSNGTGKKTGAFQFAEVSVSTNRQGQRLLELSPKLVA